MARNTLSRPERRNARAAITPVGNRLVKGRKGRAPSKTARAHGVAEHNHSGGGSTAMPASKRNTAVNVPKSGQIEYKATHGSGIVRGR